MTSTILCTSRECFWQEDCDKHVDNNEPVPGQAYCDLSFRIVVKDGVKMPCQYFEQRGEKK